jgi:hypothetical protein
VQGGPQTYDLQITNWELYRCATSHGNKLKIVWLCSSFTFNIPAVGVLLLMMILLLLMSMLFADLAYTATKNPIYVFLFWELRGPSPNFHNPHACVCERFIYSQDRSTYFLATE